MFQRSIRQITMAFTCALCLGASVHAADESPAGVKLLDVVRVWDEAPHNAFTDLIRFQGAWYMAFREAGVHGVPDPGDPPGMARILRSEDGRTWQSVALLDYGPDQDVRDPKLSITPDGRLMVVAAAAPHAVKNSRQPLVWFSDDGQHYSQPRRVAELNWWLWRVTWSPDGVAYGIGYGPINSRPRTTRLYRSTDGVNFSVHVSLLTPEPATGESTILFRQDGSAVALVRRDGETPVAQVGVSRGDLKTWTFRDLGQRVGGPDLIELPDGRLVAAGRLYDGRTRTSLAWLDAEAGTLTEFLTLPSGGDSSYPGLVYHDGILWVSYYSSHEGKSRIYLARVRIQSRTNP